MKRTIYTNARIFTLNLENPYIKNGYLIVSGDKIDEIGNMKDLDFNLNEGDKIDLKGKIVIPGMICSHSHFYGQFVRGMPLKSSPKNWQQILSELWWRVDKSLNEKQIYYSALMGIIEGIKSGTTTYIGHHASPSVCNGSLDILEEAILKTGVRACLAYEVSDRDGEIACKEGIKENIRFIKKANKENYPNTNVKGSFGLHASYTLSNTTLEKCSGIIKELNAAAHLHVAEDIADVVDSYKKSNMHVVERLEKYGILGPRTIAAHCVKVSKEEWEILRKTDTKVVHNCQSNTNNAVGISPVYQMIKDGVKVALGSDGYTYDMFKELSFALILQKLANRDPRIMNNTEMTNFTFINNFEIANMFFNNKLGKLKAGNLADFIAIDYNPPTPLNLNNFFAHLTSGFSGNVDTVVVNGKLLMKDKVLLNIDEEKIMAECRKEASKLWNKI